MKKKPLALILALALALVGVIGGTIAWLTDTSEQVVNTFTGSTIGITLAETTGEEYKMIPGYAIEKDPKVTVASGSEACFLFVKLEASANFGDFLTYDIAEGWNKLDGVADEDVYWREVGSTAAETSYDILEDNQVVVKDEVTKEDMETLTDATYPTLTVTAFASQLYKSAEVKFTPAQAWENISQ